jgi:hypothetical protein
MKWHHLIATGMFVASNACGIFVCKLSQLTLLCELSNVFLCARGFFGTKDWTGPLANLNNILFFLSYTVTRVLLFPIFIYSMYLHCNLFGWSNLGLPRQIMISVMFILFIAVYFLQLFWYKMILNTVFNPKSLKDVEDKTRSKKSK